MTKLKLMWKLPIIVEIQIHIANELLLVESLLIAPLLTFLYVSICCYSYVLLRRLAAINQDKNIL